MSTGTRRYYTIEEANQALPLVKAIVADIVRQYQDVKERKDRLDTIHKRQRKREGQGDVYSDEVTQIENEFEKEVQALQAYLDELTGLGIEIKDFEKGLIDFWSLMDGREVYLCWMLGEEEVGHWHELDAGFSGRQSLLTAVQGEDEV